MVDLTKFFDSIRKQTDLIIVLACIKATRPLNKFMSLQQSELSTWFQFPSKKPVTLPLGRKQHETPCGKIIIDFIYISVRVMVSS